MSASRERLSAALVTTLLTGCTLSDVSMTPFRRTETTR